MSQFRVFLGAPCLTDLRRSSASYQWQTVSSGSSRSSGSTSVVFPPATLAAASRRISLLYENVIFGEAEEGDEDVHKDSQENSRKHENQTTVFTWPPTEDGPRARANTQSFNLPSVSASRLQISLLETQETQETASYNGSDASSIGRFPAFSFSLHSISSLSSLRTKGKGTGQKVAVLLATLEVEGPDTIRIKQGKDAGKEVSLLKMILGDEEGNVCKLTAWREIADAWGGNDAAPSVKRGDIVYIENVTFSSDPTSSLSLTAFPYLRSKLDICYRTMPYTHEDKRLRPDLRLGVSDVAVRKVGAIVKWFEGMAGLDSA